MDKFRPLFAQWWNETRHLECPFEVLPNMEFVLVLARHVLVLHELLHKYTSYDVNCTVKRFKRVKTYKEHEESTALCSHGVGGTPVATIVLGMSSEKSCNIACIALK